MLNALLVAAGLFVGIALPRNQWPLLLLALPAIALYFWWMRPLYAGLPMPPRIRGIMSSLRLVETHER